MGLMNTLQAEVQRLNPANIIAEVESLQAAIPVFETRIAALETSLTSVVTLLQNVAPTIEAAFPSASQEITTIINALKALTPPVSAIVTNPTGKSSS